MTYGDRAFIVLWHYLPRVRHNELPRCLSNETSVPQVRHIRSFRRLFSSIIADRGVLLRHLLASLAQDARQRSERAPERRDGTPDDPHWRGVRQGQEEERGFSTKAA